MQRFLILGPIEVHDESGEVKLAGQKQRELLALLLLQANRVVPADFLIDRLWGDQPPRTVNTSLQNGIHKLRRVVAADSLEFRAPGYVLHVEPEQLDLSRFDRLVERARDEKASERAATLREALGLWRGEPLAELTFEPWAPEDGDPSDESGSVGSWRSIAR